MRVDTVFRLSIYCCLALASLCLAHAEQPYIPGFFWAGPIFAAIMVGAFFLDGRWAVSLRTANVMGLVLALVMCGWLIYHLLYAADELNAIVTGPAVVMPFVGPLLMLLIVAKVLRPKQIDDYWALHTVGLLEVVLACLLSSVPAFSFYLITYVLCLIWSLSIFNLYRGQVFSADNSTHVKAAAPAARLALPWPKGGLAPAGRWAVGVLALGFIGFLFTPRSDEHWDPAALGGDQDMPLITGSAASIDLNRTGTLQLDDRPALEVEVRYPNGEPKNDLDMNQRWRTVTLDHYDKGRWTNMIFQDVVYHDVERELPTGDLPDLGPHEFSLRFTLDTRRINRLVLADPLELWKDQGSFWLPVAFEGRKGEWYRHVTPGFQEGEFNPDALRMRQGRCQYVQKATLQRDPDLSPVFNDELDNPAYSVPFGSRIRQKMDEIIGHLMAGNRLTKKDVTMVRRRVARQRIMPGLSDLGRMPAPSSNDLPTQIIAPINREKVARAVCDYLKYSGEYTYTRTVQRADKTIDPAEDFLCNAKQGHCEQFATGLALLLRSYGIPTRVVLGFQGQDRKDDGRYIIRQSHAHSWVQVLIARPGRDKRLVARWLALDAVPATVAATVDFRSDSLWRRARLWFADFWRGYVLDYDDERQVRTAATLGDYLAEGKALLPAFSDADGADNGVASRIRSWIKVGLWIGVIFAIVWLVRRQLIRRMKRRQNHVLSTVPFYTRLLSVLDRRLALRPEQGHTPREFGDLAAATILLRTGQVGLAETVHSVIASFYRVRYGEQALAAGELEALHAGLNLLEANLRTYPSR